MSKAAKEPPLSLTGVNMAFASTIVRTLVSLGVSDAVISPGSRSTPIAVALARESKVRLYVKLDERSAGFFALGLSKISNRPTLLLTTSGTAATELRPSVTEAFHSKVPLIVATSDRPPELIGVGAAQTISQISLFDDVINEKILFSVPKVVDLGVWVSLASQAYAKATDEYVGMAPVHINLPFDEPLYDQSEGEEEIVSLALENVPISMTHKAKGVCRFEEVERYLNPALRGVIVAGGRGGVTGETLGRFADRLKWPVVVDHRFGARSKKDTFIRGADLILRSEKFKVSATPDVVVRVGEPHLSKVLSEYLVGASRSHGGTAVTIQLGPSGSRVDPNRSSDLLLDGDLESTVDAWSKRIMDASGSGTGWLDSWVRAEHAVQSALDLDMEASALSEPYLARSLVRQLSSKDMLFVSSSMPIRDVEFFGDMSHDSVTVVANRGVNGIDGVISTFLGASESWKEHGPGGVSTLLIGDLALLYDVTALIYRRCESGVIFVTDNQGGAIFSFLSQHDRLDSDEFERLFGTPQQVQVEDVLKAMKAKVYQIDKVKDVARVLELARSEPDEISVVIFRSEREQNLKEHERLYRLCISVVEETMN